MNFQRFYVGRFVLEALRSFTNKFIKGLKYFISEGQITKLYLAFVNLTKSLQFTVYSDAIKNIDVTGDILNNNQFFNTYLNIVIVCLLDSNLMVDFRQQTLKLFSVTNTFNYSLVIWAMFLKFSSLEGYLISIYQLDIIINIVKNILPYIFPSKITLIH